MNFTLNTTPHSLETTLANQTYDVIWTGLEWDETTAISGHDDFDSPRYWTDNSDTITYTFSFNYTYNHQPASVTVNLYQNTTDKGAVSSGFTNSTSDARYNMTLYTTAVPHGLESTATQEFDITWTALEWDETLTLSGYDDFSGGSYWADNTDNLQWAYAINYTYNHAAASG